ncbi:DUF92 domain-containing protein [Mucilaginibacter sp. CSA2-8R]|uniref:DUF92 domain-containing protein n=1 Tax=Mucilaginibacter sp. CSA2-8R TaxID=3141542 RepID=UPI00315D3E73
MPATTNLLLPITIILTGVVLSIVFKKLTISAAITGGLCAILLTLSAGYTGLILLTVFFLLGTLATAWEKEKKQRLKAAEADGGQRKAGQVLANAGVAAIAGAMALIFPPLIDSCRLMIGAGFAAATADTLSSELGMVYGRRFFNISTFKADQAGLDGVVSVEGTLIGFVGSIVIASIYAAGFGFNSQFFILLAAGTLGNLTDSVLGAVLERKGVLQNNAVNFLNTLAAAGFALLLKILLR